MPKWYIFFAVTCSIILMMIGYDALDGSRTVFSLWQELNDARTGGGKYANNFHSKGELTGQEDSHDLSRYIPLGCILSVSIWFILYFENFSLFFLN